MSEEIRSEDGSDIDRNDHDRSVRLEEALGETHNKVRGVRHDVDPGFLKDWINKQLIMVDAYVEDLYEDLRDGQNLIRVLEILSGEHILMKRGRLRSHMLHNVLAVLNYLRFDKNNVAVNISAEDIVDGDPTVIRDLVLAMMLHFKRSWDSTKVSQGDNAGIMDRTLDMPHVVVDPASMNNQNRFLQSTSLPANELGESSTPDHDSNLESSSPQVVTNELFWEERMDTLQPLPKLPYENEEHELETMWETSAWWQPLFDASIGNAKLMLLDAFVIYLARIVRETRLVIGWKTQNTTLKLNEDEDMCDVVPMCITVPLDKSWSSVSEAIDEELVLLRRYHTISFHGVLQDSSTKTSLAKKWPPRISVAMTQNPDVVTGDPVARGKLLTLEIDSCGGFRWIYDASYLSADVISRMSEHISELVTAALADAEEDTPVCKLSILPQKESRLLLQEWNTSDDRCSGQFCMYHYFEQQVLRTPTATALIYQNETMSYAELNEKSNRLAHKLIKLGVVPEQIVGLCVSVSPALIVGILGILKAGGAYLPLDPEYPRSRLIQYLNDVALNIVIADDIGYNALGVENLSGITVIDAIASYAEPSTNPCMPGLSVNNLAYVIYTSGSTGNPKGVMVEHHGIVHLMNAMNALFHFNNDDVLCLAVSVAFDSSVIDIWGGLCYGGKLVLVPHIISRSTEDSYQLICEHRVTILQRSFTTFKSLMPFFADNKIPEHLRHIMLNAEPVIPRLLKSLFVAKDSKSPQITVFYGPTETTVYVTYQVLNEEDTTKLCAPIGRRFTYAKIYLLDSYGSPVPLGAVGEVYIGGAAVSRGYANRSELTRKCFLKDPFSTCPDARMYKSGDLARYLPDGNLVFIGRSDHQIKLRGFRIEPGEIEVCLKMYPAVREANVRAVSEEEGDLLVAYIVANPADDLLKQLYLHVAAKLPQHMIPSAFVRLDAFPQLPNGKINTKALPAVSKHDLVPETYAPPEGDTEMAIAEIWSDLFGIQQISRFDSFFALGGHSTLAGQLIDRLDSLGLVVRMSELYENPILHELPKTAITSDEFVVPPNVITPNTTILTPDMLPLVDLTQADINRIVSNVSGGLNSIQDIYPLSPLQEGIFFHYLLNTARDPYVFIHHIAFRERNTLDRYLNAVEHVIQRHDILRTAIFWEDLSTPVQVVLRQATVPVTEVTCQPNQGSVQDWLKRRYRSNEYCMDIRKPPLFNFVVAQENDGRWILQQLFHHLAADQITICNMYTEIKAYMTGSEQTLPVPTPFRNLIANSRLRVNQEDHTRFFIEMLADVDEPSLSFGLAQTHCDGSHVNESTCKVSRELDDELRRTAKIMGVSLGTLCHLAWALVVSRTSGTPRVVFGTVLFGRVNTRRGFIGAMGLFINTLPLRLDIDDTPVHDRIHDTHFRLARLLEHEHASLALAQRCSSLPGNVPLFNTILNYRHNPLEINFNDTSLDIEFCGCEEQTNYPLALAADDNSISTSLVAKATQPVDPERLCAYMHQALQSIVDCLRMNPQTSTRLLEVMPQAERALLIDEWNLSEELAVNPKCIHQLFEECVTLNPASIALIYETESLTYAELNGRANCLAHRLIRSGVRPDDVVAICVSVSPAMITGILGILKSGAAYLPLDPTNHSQSTIDILNDAAPRIIVVDKVGLNALSGIDVSALVVIDANTPGSLNTVDPHVSDLRPRNLAYIIYTSGSTGKPKGVMVEHHNVVSLFEATTSCYDFSADDVWCLCHSVAFDVSVWEMWGALRYGGTLVLVPRNIVRSPEAMWQLIRKEKITILNQTPSEFVNIISRPRDEFYWECLRYIILGGECLDIRILRNLLADHRMHQVKFMNSYGPTETTVCATHRALKKEDTVESSNVIGWRLPHVKLYLLDRNRVPVPLAVVGELYIGGAGVARGYLNNCDLTKERFLENPFKGTAEDRIYRTGDLAKYLPDGSLLYIGRDDRQVKIRGFRVELGAIEACLSSHSLVRAASVQLVGHPPEQRLVAYVVAQANEKLPLELHRWTSSRLPRHMVPSAFAQIDFLPLTPNGKLDASALPSLDQSAVVRSDYIPPEGSIETSLATIWEHLLSIERVGRFDCFFALGGNSLSAVQMTTLAESRGLYVMLNDIYQYPKLINLATQIISNLGNRRIHEPIPVRSTGTGSPVFFLPTGEGDFSYVFSLADHIRSSCPIYTLPWPPLDAGPLSSIDELASKMIHLIKAVQIEGPYRICGYSSGGILAHAIAEHLIDDGDEISFLGFIDTPIPDHDSRQTLREQHFILRDLLRRLGPNHKDNIALLSSKISESNWLEFMEAAQDLQLYPKNFSETYSRKLKQQVNYAHLMQNYEPRDLHLTVHQFNATEPHADLENTNIPNPFARDDPSLGWAELLPNTFFKSIPLPGNHFTIVENDVNRSILGKAISDAVRIT